MTEPLIQHEDGLIIITPEGDEQFDQYGEHEVPEDGHVHAYLQLARSGEIYEEEIPDNKKCTISIVVEADRIYTRIPNLRRQSSLTDIIIGNLFEVLGQSVDTEFDSTYAYDARDIKVTHPLLTNSDFIQTYNLDIYTEEGESFAIVEPTNNIEFKMGDSISILKNETEKSRSKLASMLSSYWMSDISKEVSEFDKPENLDLSYEELEPFVWKGDREGWDTRKFLSICDEYDDPSIEDFKMNGMHPRDICVNSAAYTSLYAYHMDTQLDSSMPNIPFCLPKSKFFDLKDLEDLLKRNKEMITTEHRLEEDKTLVTHCPYTHTILAINIEEEDRFEHALPGIEDIVVAGDIIGAEPCKNSEMDSVSVEEYYNMTELPEGADLNVTHNFLQDGYFVDKEEVREELESNNLEKLFASLEES